MKKNSVISLFVILIAFGLAVFFLKDSVYFYAKPAQERQEYAQKNPSIFKRIFNLGLDLQGGMRMVLEIDRSKVAPEGERDDLLDRAYTVIENRINGLGVAEPSIQKQGNSRIIVELPGLRDEKAAKNVIGSTAQLEFLLLREPAELARAVTIIDNVLAGKSVDSLPAEPSDTISSKERESQDAARQLFEGKAQTDTESTPSEQPQKGPTSLSSLLTSMGNQIGVSQRNIALVNQILRRADVRNALDRAGLGGSVFLWGHSSEQRGEVAFRPLYYVKSRPELRGDAIKDASAIIATGGMEAGQPIVQLEMNRKGARVFSRVTGANVGKYLAIVLDSTVYSAPTIRQKISEGNAQITGNFTMEEAKNLAVVLRAGALPASVNIIEERTVGPSLGEDSIRLGLIALVVSLVLVGAFMAFYYKLSGVIANVALVLNLIFILAIMAGINLTLTLPGIAGLILIIGMSVDANVIIFERIREELALGKTVRSAIEAGYRRAFVTVFDSNATTIITGLIIFWTGTASLKGFAVTLIFGLLTNLFTAVFVTRYLQNAVLGAGKKETLSI